MATGLEAISLALAIFPVLAQSIRGYSSTLSSKDTRQLCESLKNHERIFLNSVESLFRSIVSADELHKLLNDTGGSSWVDEKLCKRVTDHLGPEADGLLNTASDIYKTLHKLQKELPVPRPEDLVDETRLTRVKKVVKGFVKGPKHRASLENLTSRIKDFRMLTDDALKLAPARQRPSRRIGDLTMVQDGANILYNTLRDGLKCDCPDEHPAHMRLEIWTPIEKELEHTLCLRFSFLFADNAQEAREDHWRIAEIVPISTGKSETLSATSRKHFPGSSSSSLPRPSSHVAFDLDDHTVTSPVAIDSIEEHEDMADLCSDFMGRVRSNTGSSTSRQRLGSMSDSGGSNYCLFTDIDKNSSTTAKSSTSLKDILSAASVFSSSSNSSRRISRGTTDTANLSPKARIGLCLMLAWGVLQLGETSWLEGHWTKDNILLVMDPSNNPRPYVSHHFVSKRRQSVTSTSSTMYPTSGHHYTSWVRNEALFALAVVLLEVCYHQTIEELAIASEKDENGCAHAQTPFLTAMRLSKDVENQMGLSYAQAVNACLFGTLGFDNKATRQDTAKLAQGVLKHIIEPLESIAGSFGHGPPLVPVG